MVSKKSLLQALLQGSKLSSDSGETILLPFMDIVIEPELRYQVKERLDILQQGASLAVISDSNTQQALGELLERQLAEHYNVCSYVYPQSPNADLMAVQAIESLVQKADLVIAVGSGTINDICKYAAFQAGKPYIVWGTAPSMNGYASANAAITIAGHKKSVLCAPPRAIYLDTDILAHAPKRLIQSGVGDALCRSTAQIDWLLSHYIMGTDYQHEPFTWLEGDEDFFFDAGRALVEGDVEAVERLAYSLILSGIGMFICNGSYPASQGEHMIAHALDMHYPIHMARFYHGEVIGITTLTMAQHQQALLESHKPPVLHRLEDADIRRFWGEEKGRSCVDVYQKKFIHEQKCLEIQEKLSADWGGIQSKLQAYIIPCQQLFAILHAVDASSAIGALGISEDIYQEIVCYAPSMRDRFTFLDVLF